VETQEGEKGASPLLGGREYWAWRRSKQEPTLRRSLEIADAKMNREPADQIPAGRVQPRNNPLVNRSAGLRSFEKSLAA
jgi:hypothetical protein